MFGEPTTYEEAKELLLSARNQENGKPHPQWRKARLFWEDDEKKTNIAVYLFNGRDRESFSEAKDGDWNRKLITLYPNGTMRLHTRDNYGYSYGYYWRGPWQVAWLFLPHFLVEKGEAVHPDAGPKPEEKEIKPVQKPRWVAKDGRGWDNASKKKVRQNYEEQVAKYGSLEKWFEAYDRYSRKREAQEKALESWQKSKTTPIFNGMVVDQDGRALHKSAVAKNEARLRAEQRKRDAQVKRDEAARQKQQREQERERKRLEREEAARRKKWLASLTAAKRVQIANLPDDIQGFLEAKSIMPEDDGTVVVYKYVFASDSGMSGYYVSSYDRMTRYVVGESTEDHNYTPTNSCGRGLHFGATEVDCRAWNSRGDKFIACRLNLTEAVVVPKNSDYMYDSEGRVIREENGEYKIKIVNYDGAKLKAKACVTLGEADPATLKLKQTPEQKREIDPGADQVEGQKELEANQPDPSPQIEGDVKIRDRKADAKKRAQQ